MGAILFSNQIIFFLIAHSTEILKVARHNYEFAVLLHFKQVVKHAPFSVYSDAARKFSGSS
jgi:hypothetical protein